MPMAISVIPPANSMCGPSLDPARLPSNIPMTVAMPAMIAIRPAADAAAAIVAKAEVYIGTLTKEANRLAQHAGRKTIKEEDVELAAKSA